MNSDIRIRISERLIRLVRAMAKDYARNTGADPWEYYFEYYLDLMPHVTALYPVGVILGLKSGQKVLEIGSGLGTRCLLGTAIWGAKFTGLEPCRNTYSPLQAGIIEFRTINSHLPYLFLSSNGEDTGLPSQSFDAVLSFEVMEHVQDPGKVIQEIYRVLKPGGKIVLFTCNYHSFYEGHYRCLWLPWLTRRSAPVWVRWQGYNPQFLDELNFITRSQLLLDLETTGFQNLRLGSNGSNALPPRLFIEAPTGFDPVLSQKRRSYTQTLIQRPMVHRLLSRFGLEYKLYITAEK